MATSTTQLSVLQKAASTASTGATATQNAQSLLANKIAIAQRAASIGDSQNPTTAMELAASKPSILRYPADTGNYFMGLLISSYVRPSIFQPLSLQASVTIALPLPANMMDAQSIRYTPKQEDAIVGMAAERAAQQLGGSAATFSEGGIAGAAKLLQQGVTSATGLAARTAQSIGNAVPGFGDAVAQLLGQAPNPFLTVQFTSPEFKQHQLSWTFSPNSPEESASLKVIIDTLKKHSLPSLSKWGGGAYMTYPDVVLPVYFPNPDQLYVFKYCVIQNIVVNWAPQGPAFYSTTKAPSTVTVSITLLEIELWLQDSFVGNSA